jgi:putative tryptophan/tyrosine transport system substrate-binding protein
MGQENRRRLLLAIGALLVVPRSALAQQSSKVWRIGYLSPGEPADFSDEFGKGMRDLGYLEGKNVVIEWRFAHGDFTRLPAQAADLVNRKVDVIVVGGTPAGDAAKRATSTIPIVMATVGDPVASGFVTSLAQPGGNITGLSLANPALSAKWFELARSVSPGSKIGLLANPKQQTAQWYVKDIQGVAEKLGIKVSIAYAATATEIEAAFKLLASERITTVIVLPTGLFFANAQQIAQFAVKHGMASIATTTGDAERGALLSYGQDYGAFNRRAAAYVDKILKGAKPSNLPIEQPTILELTINLRTAKQIGLTIPKELLFRANRVIE